MPEDKIHPNTLQILRSIKSFGERIKRNKERFGFIPNIEDVPQEETQKEIKIEEPVAAEQDSKILKNERGRAYAAHIGWGRSTMENGGII